MATGYGALPALAPGARITPPYPPRPTQDIRPWRRLQLAQQNLIAIFEASAFEQDLSETRILTKPVFLCNSPELVQYAFSTRNENFERKSSAMRHMLEPLLGDGLFISEGETWRKRRRIVSPIVQASRLSEFAPIMAETARERADRWAALPDGTEIDVLSEMAQLTAEIICRAIFGRELGTDDAHDIVYGFSEFQRAVSRIDLLSLLGLPDWMPRPRRFAVYRSVKRIHRVIDEIITSHRSRADGKTVSLVGRLMEARDPDSGKPLEPLAIRSEAVVIFMAGHETTAATLAFAWFLISQAPDVEARLHEEIDSVLGDRPPTFGDVPQLAYTRAIVEETLRLYPPIPILAREAVRDETIAGRRVPKGSLVLVAPWLLHRNAKLWDRPDDFVPERFLEENGPPPDKWSYIPFSIGPRVCAGQAFGLTEAILCVATLAQRFRLRLAEGHQMMPVCRVSLRPGDALPMTVYRKERREALEFPAQAAATPLRCPFGRG